MADHDNTTLVYDLEQGLLQRLASVSVATFDMNDDPVAVRCPALNVGLWDAKLKPLNMGRTVYEIELLEYVTLMVANPRSEAARRRDVYALFMSAAGLLAGWTPTVTDTDSSGQVVVALGLRTLRLNRIRRVLESKERLAFTLEVSTATTFEAASEAQVELTLIALQYMLKPGDDEADASDVLDVES